MSAAPARPDELLVRIAAALGVSVEAFTAPIPKPADDTAPAVHIAALVFDADGRRLAASFAQLPPHIRRYLADVADALCANFAAEQQRRAEGRS